MRLANYYPRNYLKIERAISRRGKGAWFLFSTVMLNSGVVWPTATTYQLKPLRFPFLSFVPIWFPFILFYFLLYRCPITSLTTVISIRHLLLGCSTVFRVFISSSLSLTHGLPNFNLSPVFPVPLLWKVLVLRVSCTFPIHLVQSVLSDPFLALCYKLQLVSWVAITFTLDICL